VLAVAAFVAFWVLVAFGLVFLAVRGGVGGARRVVHRQTHGANRVALAGFAFVTIAFGVALPLLVLTGNHSNASAQVGGVKLTAAERTGRELFGQHCGVCHTLAASNSIGKVGPNLDILKPAQTIVLHTINNGCLPNPPTGSAEACLGEGVMPADVVEGRAAQDVAAFVAKVAGNE
jgi:mono/diheme cytochrome c family protein